MTEKLKKWNKTNLGKDDLLRIYPFCQVVTEGEKRKPVRCNRGHNGRPARSIDLHHGIIGRDIRFEKELNVDVNYQPACLECNRERYADTYFNRMYWLEYQVRVFGFEYVRRWLNSIPDAKKVGGDWFEANERMNQLLFGRRK
jgi:hypothetical protein